MEAELMALLAELVLAEQWLEDTNFGETGDFDAAGDEWDRVTEEISRLAHRLADEGKLPDLVVVK